MNLAPRSLVDSYLALLWLTTTRHRELRRPLLRAQLRRQIDVAGVAALPIVMVLAVLTGAAVSTQLAALIGADADLTQRLLFLGLFFELAPLLSALVVVARSSAGIASELAVMNLHDEFTALRRLGVPPADFLLLPRVFGLAIALPAVTACFQAAALGSGWLATALIDGRPLIDTAGRFPRSGQPLAGTPEPGQERPHGGRDRHHCLPSGQHRRRHGASHLRCGDQVGGRRNGCGVRDRCGVSPRWSGPWHGHDA
jgi:hypothetical protein